MKITKKFEKKLIEYLDKLVDKFMELLDSEISYQKKRKPWNMAPLNAVDISKPINVEPKDGFNIGEPILWPKDIGEKPE